MREHRAIVLLGYSGSGKDTIAEYLHNSYGFTNVKFGRMHKEITAYIFNCDLSQLEDKKWRRAHKHELFGFTPLEFLTVLFQGYTASSSYVNCLHKYTLSLTDDCFPVFTDIRNECELNVIAHLNPLVIRLVRDSVEPDVNDNYIDEIDAGELSVLKLFNNTSKEDLFTYVDRYLTRAEIIKSLPVLHLFYQPSHKSSVDAANLSGLPAYEPATEVLEDVANVCQKYKIPPYHLVQLFSSVIAAIEDDDIILRPVNGSMAMGYIPQAHRRFLPKLRQAAKLRVHYYPGLDVSDFQQEELCN